jgi:hypothetical protein
MAAEPSNEEVRRAGELLRDLHDASSADDISTVRAAEAVVERFRLRFLRPHLAVRDRLEEIVRTKSERDPAPTARWKRYDRIIDKLRRNTTMRLPQMQDIGGCRIVRAAPETDLAVYAKEIRDEWEVIAEDDYVSSSHPSGSGYRALHLVVREQGVLMKSSSGPSCRTRGHRRTKPCTERQIWSREIRGRARRRRLSSGSSLG